MSLKEYEELFEKGVRLAESGNWLAALACFEKIVLPDGNPTALSYFAVCIARERGQFNRAEGCCREAIDHEPENTVHYLNLGRVFLVQGRKMEAIRLFREGLAHGMDSRIIDELNRLGTRRKPVIAFLRRDNPINKCLGIILTRLGLRK
ncbi:MAG TPA: tetratricopeptide repeat protein [Geobacteraceae bacterium]